MSPSSPTRRDPLRPANPSALWNALFSSGQWDTLADLMEETDPESPAALAVRSRRWRCTLAGARFGQSASQRELPLGTLMAHVGARALLRLDPGAEAWPDLASGSDGAHWPRIARSCSRLGLFLWADPRLPGDFWGWPGSVYLRGLCELPVPAPSFLRFAEALLSEGMPMPSDALPMAWDSPASFPEALRLARFSPDSREVLACALASAAAERCPSKSQPADWRVSSYFPMEALACSRLAQTLLDAGADPSRALAILGESLGSPARPGRADAAYPLLLAAAERHRERERLERCLPESSPAPKPARSL